jgi:RHH-type rel operon transcriptional repressor/antitoxin RelB
VSGLTILPIFEYSEYSEYMYLGKPMATSIRLEPATEQRLNRLAARTGRTKAFYLRELVKNGLDDLEDYYLAAATMERVRKGEEKVYPAHEMRKDLGLDD